MLTFFRKIRKALLDSGRISRYLLYAVGEIFLVVIGILIALQINNWNEWRKEREEERQLLSNLRIEYLNVKEQIEDLNLIRDNILSSTQRFYQIINSGKSPKDENYLDSLLAVTILNPTFNPEKGTEQLLFSSGKIDIISNMELKKALLSWTSLVEDMIEEERDLVNTYHDSYFHVLSKHVSFHDISRNVNFRGLEFKTQRLNKVQKDYKSLLGDRDFENLLSQRELLITVNKNDALNVISKANQIIQLINVQLENLH